jgi:hypothetical protein
MKINEAIEILNARCGTIIACVNTGLKLATNIAEALQVAIDIMQKHQDGLAVILPVKVGDTVYVNAKTFRYGEYASRGYAEALVTSVVYAKRNYIKFHIFSPYVSQNKVFKYLLSSIGKSVFLTREAAIAAKEAAK